MISLELATAILDRDIKYIKENESRKSLSFYTEDSSFIGEYNIHEIAHRIKEWGYDNGYEIKSFKTIGNFVKKGLYACIVYYGVYREFDAEYTTFTEPETIFKTGQWILDNKDKQ